MTPSQYSQSRVGNVSDANEPGENHQDQGQQNKNTDEYFSRIRGKSLAQVHMISDQELMFSLRPFKFHTRLLSFASNQ